MVYCVQGIDTHKAVGNVDFSNLVLSSSADWSVKLWSTSKSVCIEHYCTCCAWFIINCDPQASSTRAIHSFEDTGDYIYDVKVWWIWVVSFLEYSSTYLLFQWSPSHPSVFASCDGLGRVDLWNINHDTEVSLVRYSVCLLQLICVAGSACAHCAWRGQDCAQLSAV